MTLRTMLPAVVVCAASWTLVADTLPENMSVYPTPQRVSITAGGVTYKTPKKIAIEKAETFDADAARVLSEQFAVTPSADFKVSWTVDGELPVEGYTINLGEKSAALKASTPRGFFYAAQTLTQLLQSHSYTPVAIGDEPVVPFRGTVEGFYGQPWSFEARKSQFRFYGKVKMNAYVYGPKDDPYHGFGTRWREPYPAKEAEQIRELVRVAHENKVNFIWAVHPGNNISWKDDSDMKAAVKKFEAMYDLGVRAFAVFFDDIGGEGARAEKQVELLNYLNRTFVRTKGDVSPLLICPTQYNRAWSGGPYLETLGKGLDEDINIMWTGNSVCCDITKESMEWINNKLGRKAYIWWNWPVSDYVRSHLLMGRAYGLDPENGPLYAGFVSNPMDKPEASKIGLFGVADYTWNPRAYDSDLAWHEGIKRLFPKTAKAAQIFADNNSDQGQNGHGYRREESVTLQPIIERVEKALKAGQAPSSDDLSALKHAFKSFKHSAKKLKDDCKNEMFITETRDWLDHFEQLGEMGEAAIKAIKDPKEIKDSLEDMVEATAKMQAIADRHRKPPFDLTVVTGSRVVRPFLDQLMPKLYATYYKQRTGRDLVARDVKAFAALSNLPKLANVQPRKDGKFVHFGNVMEMVTLQPGDWFGLSLPAGLSANYIHAKLNTDACHKQGEIQLSSDNGKTWAKENTRNHGQEMETRLDVKRHINAARYINTSSSPVEIKINQFKFDLPDNAQVNLPDAMLDGRLETGYTLQPGEEVTLELNAPEPTKQNVSYLASDDDIKIDYLSTGIRLRNDDHKPVTVFEVIH